MRGDITKDLLILLTELIDADFYTSYKEALTRFRDKIEIEEKDALYRKHEWKNL